MNARTRRFLVYAGAAVAVAWCLFNFERPSRPSENAPNGTADVETSPAAAAKNLVATFDSIAALPWGDDPFRMHSAAAGPTAAAPTQVSWVVSGIVYSEDNPLAVVNSRTVKVGDIVDEATVVAISRSAVTLEKHGRQFSVAVRKG